MAMNLKLAGVNNAAIAFADKLNSSDQFFADMETAVDATTHTKVAAIFIASDIGEIFTKEEIAGMPIVDTNKTDDEKYEGNNPDWTKILDGKKTSRISYFNTMLDRSKWGISLTAELERIGDAIAGKEGCDKALKAKGKPHMEAEKARVKDRQSIVRNLFRKAMRVVQQRAKLTDMMEGILFQYWTDKDGAIIPSPKPIMLSVPSKPGLFDNFSVSQFLSLDIDEAILNRTDNGDEATWTALIATLKKGADEEEEVDDNNYNIDNDKKLETAAASMLTFLRDQKNVNRLFAKIDKAKNLDDVADYLLTLSGLATEFNDLAEHFAGRIEKASELVNKRAA